MAWPNGASAAITMTWDNMGEAADLNRGLWPSDKPIGNHYSVTTVLPQFLALARKYDIKATYFAEAWALGVYPEAIKSLANDGHEIAWHAWRHEMWGTQCEDSHDERANFERSYAAMKQFTTRTASKGEGKIEMYRGFRPPGGRIHHDGERTLRLCRVFGLGYISPAAEEAAIISWERYDLARPESLVILPFRWRGVDAYYYMDAFAGLRKHKHVRNPERIISPASTAAMLIKMIDEQIEKRGFLSLLFHPFLNDTEERLGGMEKVMQHMVKRRDEGKIWIGRCKDVEEWIRQHPKIVGEDPQWDDSSWER